MLKIDVVQRNGKDYKIISDMSVKVDVTLLKMDLKYQNLPSTITGMVGSVVNSNWKAMKSLIDPTSNKFIRDMLRMSFLNPFSTKYSHQELFNGFYHMNCAVS